jgi:alkaline phosphatase D
MAATRFSRRRFLRDLGLSLGTVAVSGWSGSARSAASLPRSRPKITDGIMCGDIRRGQAILWSRSDRPARLVVEYGLDESLKSAQRLVGPMALEGSDFTSRLRLTGLPKGRRMFYRVNFEDESGKQGAPELGQFMTAGGDRDVRFVWSGDMAGQGWGINRAWGGMKIYEVMRQVKPDFMIHSGDTIYADGPIQSEVKLDDGSIWKNLVTPEKSKVAETLQEFRGNYRYNLMDEHVRRFNAEVPVLVQWDDHEVLNNWYPGKILEDDRYQVKDVNLLASRSKQAFLDYSPIDLQGDRIYRSFNHGELLDIFMLDMRSYRGGNGPNNEETPSAATAFLGKQQIQWLKSQLKRSTATWKIIASDMPLGLVVKDGKTAFENLSNGDGKVQGREFELADLLRFIKRQGIRNVVWLTADVHYAAAHYYDPNQAQFQDFDGFWEFVAGPLHAGTFGPNGLDNTFGPTVKFQSIPADLKPNRSPKDGYQFFGVVAIDHESKALTVDLRNLEGKVLYSQVLTAIV